MISCIHPNPWILLCTLTYELLRGESEALWVKDGNPSRQVMSTKYRKLAERREQLMEKFSKNLIEEDFYLQRMGALSLKLARVANKGNGMAKNSRLVGHQETDPRRDTVAQAEVNYLP